MDMRFGTLNVRSMYRARSLRAVAEEISKYMALQEVRWDGGGTNQQVNIHFFIERGMNIMS
jgi:hypothetical protein